LLENYDWKTVGANNNWREVGIALAFNQTVFGVLNMEDSGMLRMWNDFQGGHRTRKASGGSYAWSGRLGDERKVWY
jgi:hypothetical protein